MTFRSLALLASMLFSLPASAFTLQTDSEGDVVQWRRAFSLVLDEALASQLGSEAATQALDAVLTELRDATPNLAFAGSVEHLTADAIGYRAGAKNVNAIVALVDWPYAPTNLAVTLTTLNARTNEILDTDVLFNVTSHALAVLPGDTLHFDRGYDFQNALTHELGHALGLLHSEDDTDLVMFPSTYVGELCKRVFKADDRAGLRALYDTVVPSSELAASSVDGPDAAPITGCSTSAASPLLLLSLLALSRLKRRGAQLALGAAALGSTAAFAADPADVRDADTAVISRVVARTSATHERAPGLFYTRLTLQTVECLKGACADVNAAFVWGGRVGELEQVVSHAPVPPEGALVLVTRSGREVRVHPASPAELQQLLARVRAVVPSTAHREVSP